MEHWFVDEIVDIALKALAPAINDPSRAVQSFDYLEDLMVMLAPRVPAQGHGCSSARQWPDAFDVNLAKVADHAGPQLGGGR